METALIAAGSALLGAIVGGTFSGLLELWRQIIGGLAASRILRIEMSTNATVIDFVLGDASTPANERIAQNVDFHDEAWLQLRLSVAPLLSESDLGYLQALYAGMPLYRTSAAKLRNAGADPKLEANLTGWKRQMMLAQSNLLEMERTGRLPLLWRLLRPQPKDAPTFDNAERWSDRYEEVEQERRR